MMDKLIINNISTQVIIGVYDYEKGSKQPVIIDLILYKDFSQAFLSDDLLDTLDYDAITKKVVAFVEKTSFALLEKLAAEVMKLIFDCCSIEKINIKLTKVHALRNGLASIECERFRSDFT